MAWVGGVIACLLLSGCHRPPDERALEVVRENVRAFAEGNADLARATTHPQNPLYGQMDAIFAQVRPLDLSYTLEQCHVAGSGPWEVRVGYAQVTRRRSPETRFRDNRVTGEHLLRLDGGKWKILATKVQQIEYLAPPIDS
ncbi:MAG TPA: hypothetical protein VIM61_14095 [Chthoniobacterales bacterium]